MQSIARLRNPIRNYAWGSRTALAALQGRPVPSPEPEAELWIGAHPSAPSQVLVDGRWRSLLEVIEENPRDVLGARVVERFGPRLPFLLKALAVERPLSLQVHPDAEHAREGFERENAAGIPLDAAKRNYRDPHAKPELVCALTPFWALRGFRPPAQIADLLGRLDVPSLAPELRRLTQGAEAQALREFFTGLLGMERSRGARVAAEAAAAARGRQDEALCDWIIRLHREHPDDPCILAPAFLKLIRLEPGQAMFLPPGELHAYLHGVAVELMASSDNVLRGGLTAKSVDVPELLRVARFSEARLGVLTPSRATAPRVAYPTIAAEFELTVLRVPPPNRYAPHAASGILFCTEGCVAINSLDTRTERTLSRGESCLVSPAVGACRVQGSGVVYCASLPRKRPAPGSAFPV